MLDISVIIPSFKPQSYLYECLESLKSQTFDHNHFEIIIILNGCKEPYYSDIQNYIKHSLPDMNINFIQTDIPGVSNARNIGLDNAKGEYICFVDDDDIVSPNYLSDLLENADEDSIVISNIYSFIHNINEKRKNFFVCNKLSNKERYAHASLFSNRSFLAFPVAKIIHKSIIENRRFNCKFKNGEDALFMTSISDKIKDFRFTNNTAIYYVRERVGSASRRKFNFLLLTKDTLLLLLAYFSIYFSKPLSYNLPLFLSRIPGVIKGAIQLYKSGRKL